MCSRPTSLISGPMVLPLLAPDQPMVARFEEPPGKKPSGRGFGAGLRYDPQAVRSFIGRSHSNIAGPSMSFAIWSLSGVLFHAVPETAGTCCAGLPGLAKTIIFKAPLGSTDCCRPFRPDTQSWPARDGGGLLQLRLAAHDSQGGHAWLHGQMRQCLES